ncbi:cytochrome c oxidase assembly protein [Arenibaculum pallidiluteum]|uniref:cytochrome c oxidase assembly protein n=1 Tax=Arenibaculum pallidiluteum TaxID=2812559 RepID=UPI001A96A2ED|nr:cytochrome c oxidase assembly protein [Arenibaculum pallidiluteum]
MAADTGYIPYCGAPPVPGGLEWNLDPWLLAVLSGILVCHRIGWLRSRRAGHPAPPAWPFVAGWAIAALALVSPLCNLSVALFGARVGQHIVLTLVAAPLVAAGRPGLMLIAFAPGHRSGAARRALGSMASVACFAALLWTWHLSGPYGATLASDWVYWSMHLSLFAAAVWLWSGLLDPSRPHVVALGSFLTAIQMSLLGALLTLAPKPLFEAHAATTWAWGLTPLEDQQLGGLLMWVPGGLLFVAGSLVGFALWLRAMERRTALDASQP